MDPKRMIPGDATLIENIVNYLKAKGIFDEFRHECLADVDTKSSCQNLSQRVDGYTSKFLSNETWDPDCNKNELRNKLRRHIDESGMLAVGADHVVEQVINPKVHQLFLPKIIEVVHQYIKEQNELLNKKPEITSSDNTPTFDKTFSDASDSKVKTPISDPIADILSFSYSKSKPIPTTTAHIKTEQKHSDLPKVEKKKEEKPFPIIEKSTPETLSENTSTPVSNETKIQIDKDKENIKKENQEAPQEIPKKVIKEEFKPEKKKIEDLKVQSSETISSVEESKVNVCISIKPTTLTKKEFDRSRQKLKSSNTQKSSNSSSEVKKSKKELTEKHTEKFVKSKSTKSLKESSSPTKSISSIKSVFNEEKIGESSKSKSSDSSSSKTSDSSVKKGSKSSGIKKEGSKHKGHNDKSDKSKTSKSSEKNDQNIQCASSSNEKTIKNIHYSSSYDSSQGSDQEKSSSSSSRKEKQKHFSKHVKKEKSEDHSDKSSKILHDKKRPGDLDESLKKFKSEESTKNEKLKDIAIIEAAQINSRSNSFGSTSSVSSSSKDNSISNSDEVSESSLKDKKSKLVKEKDSCHDPSKTLPPPPPPPPPSSSSLLCELTSSAEMSSMEDTQSSRTSEDVSSDGLSGESSSDSELEARETVNESILNSSNDNNYKDFYDIFLYSSSSSEFEDFENVPQMTKKEIEFQNIHDSDVSVSSVHTGDLSSYDDELSDEFSFLSEFHPTAKKKITLKEAQEYFKNKAALFEKSKNSSPECKIDTSPVPLDESCIQKSAFVLSGEESSPSEPTRSLRRERKLNPRYASSEYTSIFNSRKESFITKQSSPVKNNSYNSPPNTEPRKRESLLTRGRLLKKSSVESRINAMHQDEIKQSQKAKNILNNSEFCNENELNDISGMSSSDEMDSIMDKEIFEENNKPTDISDNDHIKIHLKLKLQKNSRLNNKKFKRKRAVSECMPAKRPCSRSSIDSLTSEIVPNENKPFNNEKRNLGEDKIVRDGGLKGSGLTDGIKKDLFCKQRINNNGDVLGQKDIFPKNSHGKTINISEKTNESDTSKELNAL